MAGNNGAPASDAINHCQLTQADFERAAGIACPSCGRETLRLLPLGKRQVCLACSRKAIEHSEQEMEMKALLRSLRESRRRNRK